MGTKRTNEFVGFGRGSGIIGTGFGSNDIAHSRRNVVCFNSTRKLYYFRPERILSIGQTPGAVVASLQLVHKVRRASDIVGLTVHGRVSLTCSRGSFTMGFAIRGFTVRGRIRCDCVLSNLRGS